MTFNHLTDQELLQRVFLNNEQAFNELFERHWSKVYAVSLRYLKDEEIAKEITHDIFLNIWNKRNKLNINSFKSYIITASSYHSIRKKQQMKAIPLSYVADYTNDDQFAFATQLHENNTAEDKISENEFNAGIGTVLNGLPKRCREIYLLSRNENLSIAEISSRLNISKRTVENQLTVALKHLRTFLKHSSLLLLLLGKY
ncbi:RNA polymerase sigma-70 factor [Pedobacter frigiditerrae]|uniref:RNA polymerase sigma-70 factor n=1 Tax=Pedobacter frigiditerrae TaxID=2530452 RepID=A0A4R0MML3_9SPHI|nr:RNA polymerase sigma-70 factor [Pedobacter frigiditerrae]TCC87955.1 RNA polymerase sigma-70 factor [Pedobacter frigiditerrae]